MSKTLIACFSASGVTAGVCRALAEITGADLYAIEPQTPYTPADLDWRNPASRSSMEMKDKASRPALADTAAPVAGHDTVVLAFPIWWYVAPTIINSFLEAYDFSGKRIVLLATSGMSGFGSTAEELRPSAPGAQIQEGIVLHGQPGRDQLAAFARQAGI